MERGKRVAAGPASLVGRKEERGREKERRRRETAWPTGIGCREGGRERGMGLGYCYGFGPPRERRVWI